jgi:hypothetical protein
MSHYEDLLARKMMDGFASGIWAAGSYDCQGKVQRGMIVQVCVAVYFLLKSQKAF